MALDSFYPRITTVSVTLKLDVLQFPASQVASSDPNALDDYEEGTWTPVLGGDGGASGQTYASQKGAYTKLGRVVHLNFECNVSAIGTMTGTLAAITGLPFTPAAGIGAFAGTIGYANAFASNIQTIGCYASGSVIFLNGSATTGVNPLANLAKTVLMNGTIVYGSITYMV